MAKAQKIRYNVDNTIMKGITIPELMKGLGISYEAVRARLRSHKIKELYDGKIYPESALEAISNTGPQGFQKGNTLAAKKPKTPDRVEGNESK